MTGRERLRTAEEALRGAVAEESHREAGRALEEYRAAAQDLESEGGMTPEMVEEARKLLHWARMMALSTRSLAHRRLMELHRPPSAYGMPGLPRHSWELEA